MLFPGLCEGNLLLLREALEDSGGVQKFQGFGLQNKGNLENMGIFDRKKTSSQLCVCVFFLLHVYYWYTETNPGVLQRCGFEWIRPDSDTYINGMYPERGPSMTLFFWKLVGHGGHSRETCNQLELGPNAFHEL